MNVRNASALTRRRSSFGKWVDQPDPTYRAPPFAIGLVRLSLTLCASILFLCAVSITYGGIIGLPTALRDIGFSNCQTPCFMDIEPGVTLWETARANLEARGVAVETNVASLNFGTRNDSAFMVSADGTHAGAIYVFLPPDRFSVGWLLELYGQPCGASIYPRTQVITLRYPAMIANLAMTAPFNANTSVTTLLFADLASPHGVIWSQCRDDITIRVINVHWRGFVPLQRLSRYYINEAPS